MVTRIKNEIKIFVGGQYPGCFKDIGWIDNAYLCSKMEDADIVLFPDHRHEIPTHWYGEEPHVYHKTSETSQDKIEWNQLREARKLKKPIIGVGRGSFMLATYEDCKIIQYCTHHQCNHKIHTLDKQVFWVNSDHNNLIYPYNLKGENRFEVLGYYLKDDKIYNNSGPQLKYENGDRKEFFHGRVPIKMLNNFKEPEVIWFPKTKSLAISFNPSRFDNYGTYKEALNWIADIVKLKLTNELTCQKELELSAGALELTALV